MNSFFLFEMKITAAFMVNEICFYTLEKLQYFARFNSLTFCYTIKYGVKVVFCHSFFVIFRD